MTEAITYKGYVITTETAEGQLVVAKGIHAHRPDIVSTRMQGSSAERRTVRYVKRKIDQREGV